MSNTTDQLAPGTNASTDVTDVNVDASIVKTNTNESSSLSTTSDETEGSSSPSFDEKVYPPPDDDSDKEPPPTSPSPSPPVAKSPPPSLEGSNKSTKSPTAESPDDSPSSPPPPPPLVPPPTPSPSTPITPPPSPSSSAPPPPLANPPPSSPPPPLQAPPSPSPPPDQVSPPTPSNQPPPPTHNSPTLPSPPPPPYVPPPPENVSPATGPLGPSPPNPVTTPDIPSSGYPHPPPLTEAPPSTQTTHSPPTTTETPTVQGSQGDKTSGSSTSLTKSNSDSSSTSTPKHPSESESLVRGAVIGITLAGVAVIVVAVLFMVSRRKKRRIECLAVHYTPTHGYSMRPDGYYYGQATTPVANSSNFASPYSGPPPSFSSANGTYGSFHEQFSYSGSPKVVGLGNSKSLFTYEEITEMTSGFSRQNLLGEGGFGCVYKGWLTNGRAVAVKQLKHGSGQGEREFKAEVEIISRVHHRHLVSLVGYCIADNHRSLVYEFLPNKTLEYHLHGKGLPVMEWSKRLRIAIGAARGLAYLHDDCHPKIIHRDIKTANILLDETFEAQVADFGLARLTNDTHTHVSTRVVGTFGYMAPEYASSGKLTDKSDVFSFGVVLLELITGRKPVDTSQPLGEESLVEWARPLLVDALESGNFDVLVDQRLDGNYSKSEMFRMMEAAASCVRHSATKRPRMVQVLRSLDTVGELSDLSNGLKFGQSTVFDSRQYSADIQEFGRMAFGSDSYISDRSYTEEFDSDSSTVQSGEYNSHEALCRPLNSGRCNSRDYQSSHDFSSDPSGRRPGEPYGSHGYSGHDLH